MIHFSHCIYIMDEPPNDSWCLRQFSVKSSIQYYNYYGSHVYTCFLNASKAFDRINHWTMFEQIILRNVPIILIRILCFLVSISGTMYIMGKHEVLFFTASNGVRQGGILSLKLFSVYMFKV